MRIDELPQVLGLLMKSFPKFKFVKEYLIASYNGDAHVECTIVSDILWKIPDLLITEFTIINYEDITEAQFIKSAGASHRLSVETPMESKMRIPLNNNSENIIRLVKLEGI